MWMISPRRLVVAVIALPLMAACGRGPYTFATSAVYEAPKGQCRLEISAGGTVAAGADLSTDGRASGTIRRTGNRAGSHRSPLTVEMNGGWIELNGRRETKDQLTALGEAATEAGCALDGAELDEMLKAATNVIYGPKGTLMDGQTKAIVAVSTRFDR
jgi:hypothetical protein